MATIFGNHTHSDLWKVKGVVCGGAELKAQITLLQLSSSLSFVFFLHYVFFFGMTKANNNNHNNDDGEHTARALNKANVKRSAPQSRRRRWCWHPRPRRIQLRTQNVGGKRKLCQRSPLHFINILTRTYTHNDTHTHNLVLSGTIIFDSETFTFPCLFVYCYLHFVSTMKRQQQQ